MLLTTPHFRITDTHIGRKTAKFMTIGNSNTQILTSSLCWFAISLCLSAYNPAYALGNCTFSDEAKLLDLYADNESIVSFHWFEKSNEAKGVLANGNLFSVKYWSCDHYGKQAIMVIGPQMQTYPDELNDYVIQLGKLALNEFEAQLLNDVLKTKHIQISDSPILVRVQSNEYDDFYVKIDILSDTIFIEIKLYKS